MQQNHQEERGWGCALGGGNPMRSAPGTECSMNYRANLGQTNTRQQIWGEMNQSEKEPHGQLGNLQSQEELMTTHEFRHEHTTTIDPPGDTLRKSQRSLHQAPQACSSTAPAHDEGRVREGENSMNTRQIGIEGTSDEVHRQRLLQMNEAREALSRSTMGDQGQNAKRTEPIPASFSDPAKGVGWSERRSGLSSSQVGGQLCGGGTANSSGAEPSLHPNINNPPANQVRPPHPTQQAQAVSGHQKQIVQAAPSIVSVSPGAVQIPQGGQGQNSGLHPASAPSSHTVWNSMSSALGARYPSNENWVQPQVSSGLKAFPNQTIPSWDGGRPKMNFVPLHMDALGRAALPGIAGGLPVGQSSVVLPGAQHQHLLGPHIPNPYLASFMAGQIPPANCYSQLMTQAAMLGMQLQPQLMVNFHAARSLSMLASEQQMQQQKSLFKLPHAGIPAGMHQMPVHGQMSRTGKLSSKAKKPAVPLSSGQNVGVRSTPQNNAAQVVAANSVDADKEKTFSNVSSGSLAKEGQVQGLMAKNKIDLCERPVKATSSCVEACGIARDVSELECSLSGPTSANRKEAQVWEGGHRNESMKQKTNEALRATSSEAALRLDTLKETQERIDLTMSAVPRSLQVLDTPATATGAGGDQYVPGVSVQEANDRFHDPQMAKSLRNAPRSTTGMVVHSLDQSIPSKRCDTSDLPLVGTEGNGAITKNNSRNQFLIQDADIAALDKEFDSFRAGEMYVAIDQAAPVQKSGVGTCSGIEPLLGNGKMGIDMPNVHVGTEFENTTPETSKLNRRNLRKRQGNMEQIPINTIANTEPLGTDRHPLRDEARSLDQSSTSTDQSGTDYPILQQDSDMHDEVRGSGRSDKLQYRWPKAMDLRKQAISAQPAELNPARNSGSFLGAYSQSKQQLSAFGKRGRARHTGLEYTKTRLCVMGLPSSKKSKSKCPKLATFGLPGDGSVLCSVNSVVGSSVVCYLADSGKAEDPENLLSTMGSMVPVPVSLDSCVEELQSEIQSTRGLNSEGTSSIKSPGACSTQVYEMETPAREEMEDEPSQQGGGICQELDLYEATTMEDVQYEKKILHDPPEMDNTQTSKRARVYASSDDHPLPSNLSGLTGLVDVPIVEASEEDATIRKSRLCPANVHAFDTTVVCSLRASKRQGLDTVFMSTPVLKGKKSTVCAVVGFDYEDSATLCWTGAEGLNGDMTVCNRVADDQWIEVPVEDDPSVT